MNNKYKILLVEDEENIRNFLFALIESAGYRAILAEDAATGKMMYSSHVPDLVILDLGLPDADGGELLSFIRRSDLTPVIVLSARTDEEEKVKMLDLGANDYVTKPFGSSELLARIRTALRDRRQARASDEAVSGIFRLGELEVRYDSRRVFILGEEIKLTQTEFNILALLSEQVGRVMTYSSIIKAIWHEFPDEGNIKRLQVNMANIRKKFGCLPGEASYIVNELGVGYRLDEPGC